VLYNLLKDISADDDWLDAEIQTEPSDPEGQDEEEEDVVTAVRRAQTFGGSQEVQERNQGLTLRELLRQRAVAYLLEHESAGVDSDAETN
jgi:hypothetical protein